jgi:hypothetical protein
MLMRFKVHPAGRRGVGFFFPVILIWIVLLALLVVILPILLLAAAATWRRGPGVAFFLVYPLFLSVLWNLGGFRLETKNAKNEVLIDFT